MDTDDRPPFTFHLDDMSTDAPMETGQDNPGAPAPPLTDMAIDPEWRLPHRRRLTPEQTAVVIADATDSENTATTAPATAPPALDAADGANEEDAPSEAATALLLAAAGPATADILNAIDGITGSGSRRGASPRMQTILEADE